MIKYNKKPGGGRERLHSAPWVQVLNRYEYCIGTQTYLWESVVPNRVTYGTRDRGMCTRVRSCVMVVGVSVAEGCRGEASRERGAAVATLHPASRLALAHTAASRRDKTSAGGIWGRNTVNYEGTQASLYLHKCQIKPQLNHSFHLHSF